MTGKVVLVGAGPGDAELITVKGLKVLQQADVVLFDRLIPMALLNETRADAEHIDVGKLPTKHRVAQEDINRLLIDHAQQGKLVVRLKGGDPFVFGRGGEEGLACHAAGIPFEVVPGVSSAIAVPAYAGVPVTHRQVASAFTVFTGHADPTKAESEIDYAALAAAARLGTLVLLMGVANLAQIAARLQAEGIPADTPAICIEWGTTPQQRTVEGTLATLPALVAAAGIGTPALTVIGAVVELRKKGLDWLNEGQG